MKMKKIKILVINDDKAFCESLKELLTEEGYLVKYALNGPRALRCLRSERFHLGILDLKMPRMPGNEVLKRIRAIDPKMGIIILTAYPSVDTAVETLKNEAIDYLTKPIKVEDLRRAINEAVKKIGLIRLPLDRLKKTLGERVRTHRKERGLSLRDIAQRTGLSVSLISQIEKGKTAPSLSTLCKIGEALGVKISKLVEGI